jgi:hypothetical protein
MSAEHGIRPVLNPRDKVCQRIVSGVVGSPAGSEAPHPSAGCAGPGHAGPARRRCRREALDFPSGHDPAMVDDRDHVALVLDQLQLVAGEQHRDPRATCSSSTAVMSSTPSGSRPSNGSSSTKRQGSCTSAAASWTRCWFPLPELLDGSAGASCEAEPGEVDELVCGVHPRIQAALLGHIAESKSLRSPDRSTVPVHPPTVKRTMKQAEAAEPGLGLTGTRLDPHLGMRCSSSCSTHCLKWLKSFKLPRRIRPRYRDLQVLSVARVVEGLVTRLGRGGSSPLQRMPRNPLARAVPAFERPADAASWSDVAGRSSECRGRGGPYRRPAFVVGRREITKPAQSGQGRSGSAFGAFARRVSCARGVPIPVAA